MKERFPRHEALAIADELVAALLPYVDRIVIAGSLRRRRPDVGDIELLYIPSTEENDDPDNLFGKKTVSLTDVRLQSLIVQGVLELRKNVLGRTIWGPKNKLMRHVPSGIPVDLFAATERNWYSLLICRTGSAELNKRICVAAQEHGWKWKPYEGLQDEKGQMHYPQIEQDVFAYVGLPWLEPWERS